MKQQIASRAEFTVHDKHYDRDLTVTWVNDVDDQQNGVVLMVKSPEGPLVSVGLSFADARAVADFIANGGRR
jgi:hypothetical protein